jgi:hypothetical protein
MLVPLLLLAVFVAFDAFYLHQRRARITERRHARHEVWLHVARGVVFYTLEVFVMSNVWFEGAYHAAFVALCGVSAATVAIAVADMLCELDARRRRGLPEARTSLSSRSRNSERSFARLRRALFADAGSPVVGRRGGEPAPVPALALALTCADRPREPGLARSLPVGPGLPGAARGGAQASPRRRALAGTPG